VDEALRASVEVRLFERSGSGSFWPKFVVEGGILQQLLLAESVQKTIDDYHGVGILAAGSFSRLRDRQTE